MSITIFRHKKQTYWGHSIKTDPRKFILHPKPIHSHPAGLINFPQAKLILICKARNRMRRKLRL